MKLTNKQMTFGILGIVALISFFTGNSNYLIGIGVLSIIAILNIND